MYIEKNIRKTKSGIRYDYRIGGYANGKRIRIGKSISGLKVTKEDFKKLDKFISKKSEKRSEDIKEVEIYIENLRNSRKKYTNLRIEFHVPIKVETPLFFKEGYKLERNFIGDKIVKEAYDMINLDNIEVTNYGREAKNYFVSLGPKVLE